MTASRIELARELNSEQCVCGGAKARGKSLCYACWKSLPRDIAEGLYREFGDGYEEARARAHAHLRHEAEGDGE